MTILGNIIKSFLNTYDSLSSPSDHIQAQRNVLKKLLEKAVETEFGQKFHFKHLVQVDDPYDLFKICVPYHDYKKIDSEWWHKIKNGQENITWPDKPRYMARSSGTTGKKSKKIPVTVDMVEAIRYAGARQLSALTNFNLSSEVFEKEVMALGSSTNLEKMNGFVEGEISGISASNIPGILDNWYRPGPEISAIDDWDKRVSIIAQKSKEWDIGTVSGIPSWIELMLKEVIAFNKAKHIHEVWPNLSVFTSGGVAFGPYEESFNALLGKPVQVVDTYLASEGFIACQQRPDTDAMQLITDGGIFFEFVPFKEKYILSDGSLSDKAPAISLAEVEQGIDYVLVISTVSGAWRYLIGDTIMFTNVERAEIKITGRTKFFMNVVGSQLSVIKMEDALKKLGDRYNTQIKEFTMCAKKINGEYHHIWYLGTDTTQDNQKLAKSLDEFLKGANKNYKVARSKALKGVQVYKVHPELFNNWNDHQKKKGGQVKMEKVMKEEKFQQWEEFVNSTL